MWSTQMRTGSARHLTSSPLVLTARSCAQPRNKRREQLGVALSGETQRFAPTAQAQR